MAPKNFAADATGKHEAGRGPSASNVTSYMEEFSFPRPSPVEPSPDTKGGDRAHDASQHQEAAEDAEPERVAPRRAGKKSALRLSPEPITNAAAFYRSIRTLSISLVIVSVSTTVGSIVLVRNFTSAQERQLRAAGEHEKEAVATATTAHATQASAREQQLIERVVMPIAELQKGQAELARSTAAEFREVKVRLDEEQRIISLPAQMTWKQHNDATSKLAAVIPKITDREAKREAVALQQSLRKHAPRPEVYQGLRRLDDKLPTGEAKTGLEDVKRPIMGF